MKFLATISFCLKQRRHSYIFHSMIKEWREPRQKGRKEYLNIVNGHFSIKQKFSAILVSCECKYLYSKFHLLLDFLEILNYIIWKESQDSSTKEKKRKRTWLLWEYFQKDQNNPQQAFQHLHYPFPHEQRSAAKDHCTVEISHCRQIKILWGSIVQKNKILWGSVETKIYS